MKTIKQIKNLYEKKKERKRIKNYCLSFALGTSLFLSGMFNKNLQSTNLVYQVSKYKVQKQQQLVLEDQTRKAISEKFYLTQNQEKPLFALAQQELNSFFLTDTTNQFNTKQDITDYFSANKIPEQKPAVLENIQADLGDYVMVVDKERQMAEIYQVQYVRVDQTQVSTGKNPGEKQRTGDNKTPTGVFEVVSVQNSSQWVHNGRLAYGPYAARLDCGSWDSRGNYNPDGRSSILAHGTDEPEKLNEPASEGCIRMGNDTNRKYVEKGIIRVGTKVAIIDNLNHLPGSSYVSASLPQTSQSQISQTPLPKTSNIPEGVVEAYVTSIRPGPEFLEPELSKPIEKSKTSTGKPSKGGVQYDS